MTTPPLTQPATAQTPVERAPSSAFRAGWRTAAVLATSVILLSGYLLARLPIRDPRKRMAQACRWSRTWTRWCVGISGIRVTVKGTPPAGAALLAPNHHGYADILALGSVIPCCFVAKDEVGRWPVIGILFNTAGHIGVCRTLSRGLVETLERMSHYLSHGQRVCVFLEGTTTAGDRVLPFHAPLVEPAIRAGVPLIPVSIRWHSDDPRVDIGEDVSYWKDHVFGPHAWRLIGMNGLIADITFGDPLNSAALSRKGLADEARRHVAEVCGLPMRSERGDTP